MFDKKQYFSKYYQDNKIIMKDRSKKQHVKEKEKRQIYYRVYNKTYYPKNKEKIDERNRLWDKRNPDKRLEISKRFFEKQGSQFDLDSITYKKALYAWSKTVKTRDNYTCQDCGSTENLHAHHVLPKKDYPEFSLLTMNGLTECMDCHHKIHRSMS